MKNDEIKDLAYQRINWLLDFAEKVHKIEPSLADRYIEIAFAVAKKARLHYPPRLKAVSCRKCGAYLIPGITARVRVKNRGRYKYLLVTCLKCGYTRRYPLKKNPFYSGQPWYPLYKRDRKRGNTTNT